MGPAEIAERVAQAVAIRVDRAGVGRRVSRAPDPASLAAGFDGFQEGAPVFFAGVDDLGASTEALRVLDPGDEERVCASAEAILDGRLRLFGADLDVGSPPDWHHEPMTGVRYPDAHWSRIDYLRPEIGGEYKTAWEIARHQYLLDLGFAYAYRQDERYAEAFTAHVRDSIRQNPPGQGIHWTSSLEVAFRVMSWIWGLHLFRGSAAVDARFFGEVASQSAMHGRHIARYLSTYFSPNTHLTGECLALYWIGSTFPALDEADRWRDTAWRILAGQLPVHIRPDGTYFEQSTAYARYTVDFYLHLRVLRERQGRQFPDGMRARLEAALDAMQSVTRPDGTTPHLGDDDGGRLLPADGRPPNDMRAPLGTGAILYGRPDFRAVAGRLSPETVWLLGPSALDRWNDLAPAPPTALHVGLRDGGVFVQRDGWDTEASMGVIDCGPLGTLNCGHAHADLLSVDLTVRGRPVVVDSGTFTYTSDPRERNRFRAGAAHNGLTLDGEGSSRPSGPFQWSQRCDGELLAWQEDPEWSWFLGRERFPSGWVHDRGIFFRPGRGWLILDRAQRQVPVDGAGSTEGRTLPPAQLSFHLAPGLDAVVEAGARAAVVRDSTAEEERDATRVTVVDALVDPVVDTAVGAGSSNAVSSNGGSGNALAVFAWPGPTPRVRVERTTHSPSYRVGEEAAVIRVEPADVSAKPLVTLVAVPGAIEVLMGDVARALDLMTGENG